MDLSVEAFVWVSALVVWTARTILSRRLIRMSLLSSKLSPVKGREVYLGYFISRATVKALRRVAVVKNEMGVGVWIGLDWIGFDPPRCGRNDGDSV